MKNWKIKTAFLVSIILFGINSTKTFAACTSSSCPSDRYCPPSGAFCVECLSDSHCNYTKGGNACINYNCGCSTDSSCERWQFCTSGFCSSRFWANVGDRCLNANGTEIPGLYGCVVGSSCNRYTKVCELTQTPTTAPTVNAGPFCHGAISTCTVDSFEPNNTREVPSTISPNIEYSASICLPVHDLDWYKFSANTGDQVTVDLYNMNWDFDLGVFKLSGVGVGISANKQIIPDQVIFTADRSDFYYIEIMPKGMAEAFCGPYNLKVTINPAVMTMKAYIGQDWTFEPGYVGASCKFEGYINTCQAPYRQFAKTLACRPDGTGIGADGTVYFVGCKYNLCGSANYTNDTNWNDVGTVGSGKSAEVLGTAYLSWTNQVSEATFTTNSYYAEGYKVLWRPSDPARNYNLCVNATYNPTFGQVSGIAKWHQEKIMWSDPNTNFTTAVWMPVYSAAPTSTPVPPTPTPFNAICSSPLPTCTLGTQLLTNPTFDTDTSGWSPWTPQYTTANWDRGAAHIHSAGPTGRSCWSQDITNVGGKRLRISAEMFRTANMGSAAPYIGFNAYVNRGGTMVWENNYGGVTPLTEVNACTIKSKDIYIEPAVSTLRAYFCVWDATAGESYANWVSVCKVPSRCGEICSGASPTNPAADCATDLCYIGVCRSSACPTATDCNCATCSCNVPGDTTSPTNTPIPTPTPIPANITGRGTYLDINNNCTYEAGVDQIPTNSTTYRLQQTAPASCTYDQSITSANGSISYSNLGCFSSTNTATYRLTATYNNTYYQFVCAGSSTNSAQFSINVIPSQSVPFSAALSARRNGWIQGYGAELYVNGSITNSIPSSAATRAFIRSDATMSSGVVSLANSINLNSAPVSSDSTKLWLSNPYTQTMPASMGYTGLYNSIISGGLVDYTYSAGSVSWPSPTGSAYTDGVVITRMATGNSVINSNVNLNHRAILFVEGDLTINSTITLGANGFLMIVTSDNIIINPTLGTTPNDDTAQLEGLFIAGGSLIANGSGAYSDLRLNFKGTIVTGVNGSGTYVSNRTHQQISQYPSDYFIFNPKLLLNAPRVLTSPIFSWNISRDE